MTRNQIAVSTALALTLVAGSAFAQARTPTMPAAPGHGAMVNAYSGRDITDFERNRADMTRQREEAEEADPERVALADRVAALVAEGKCREARDMANEAGDRQMALRVRQTCRAN